VPLGSAGTAYLDVKPELTRGFHNDLNRSVQGSRSRFAGVGKKVGLAMAAGIGAALAGSAVLVKQSIDNAADLGEAINKTEVVFKGAAGTVKDFSKTTANDLGISRAAALEAAGGYGAMFQALGLARKPAADMSMSLVKLAADMGSLHNQDPTEMLEKIRAGMSGEMEPLKQFGIVLSETAVKEHAYKEGIAARGAELEESEKVQARYSLLMKQSAAAHGDFGNTMNSLPNLQRRFSAGWTDLTAKLGKAFLPIAEKVMSFFVGALPGALDFFKDAFASVGDFLEPVVEWFKGLSVSGDAVKSKFSEISSAVGPVIAKFVDLGKSLAGVLIPAIKSVVALGGRLLNFVVTNKLAMQVLASIITGVLAVAIGQKLVAGIKAAVVAFNVMKLALLSNPFTAIAIAIAALATLIYLNWDTIKETTIKVWNSIKGFLGDTWNAILQLFGSFGASLTGGFRKVVVFILDAVTFLLDKAIAILKPLPGNVEGPLVAAREKVGDFRKGVDSSLRGVEDSLRDLGRTTADVFGRFIDKVNDGTAKWNDFKSAVEKGAIPKVAAFSFVPPATTGGGGGLGPGMGLVSVGQRLQAGGYRVAGHPSFPPIGGHAPGSYHYMGRAIDINWGPPGQSIGEQIKLNALAGALRNSLGNRIRELFYPAYDPYGGHQDHLHLAMDRGGIVKGPATIHQGNIREAHIPLSGPGAKSLGNTFVFNIHTDSTQDGRKLARFVRQEFTGMLRRAEALNG
jgi:hypothetical protein